MPKHELKVNISQERLETNHQVLHEIDKLMQAWEQRIRLGNIRLADRFCDFELNVLLHLCFDSGEEGILGFQKISPVEPVTSEKEIMCEGKQGTMLVDVVKLVDSPECIVPTFVWFEFIDSLTSFWKHSLCFSSLVGFVFLESLCNRKFDSSKLLFSKGNDGSTVHTDKNQLSCEVIQCGTNVVNNISRDSYSVKRQGGDFLKLVGVPEIYRMGSDTRIWIGRENCRVLEGNNLGCKITQVLLGPLNLNLNQNNAVSGV